MNIAIDHTSSVPFHKQIEDVLRTLIDSGDYDNGKLFPKEVDISNRLGVSRNTVRQAINTLVGEGLLARKKGVGTTVPKKKIGTKLSEWHSFTQEMNNKGIPFKNYKVDLSFQKADEKLANLLNIEVGKEVNQLVRVRGDKETPFVYFVSWFHPKVQFDSNEKFDKPLYDIIEEKSSIFLTKSSEELTAMLADKELAALLEVEEGSPILFRKRIVSDPGGRVIEINEGYYRADRFTYQIEINK
ncbi:GntR family transcriptional regulator [Flammeovirga kamogawensis]|uniref:GntR family transcriptional regulator n=1 Tax=Flammeovirga kamogawensis TaxID=373891 RepID=A0ABX8H3K9_9BACT|nr:GntR family transcriptional regulator [Flammeovirga kamogawensis]MBB6461912.1 GntR family transcriptional regulator [Flammeovirga kamogawensis]QWG10479.1 GntR family transcriptional regulator [Flammeovirga kamogawensis]TRX63590.1 GntR family transcriptional regulator [Flammeovirga kamogawensis]